MRGGSAGAFRQPFFENFARRSEAETLARGGVEPLADRPQLSLGDGRQIGLSGQEAPEPPVGVLDRTLLPRRLRLAEPAVDAEIALQRREESELGSPVEGDASAGAGREPAQMRSDARHHTGRMATGVAGEQQIAALAFDQGSEVGLAELFPERHEIALPMAEIRSLADGCGADGDGVRFRHEETARLAGEAGTTSSPSGRQQTEELVATPIRAVDVSIDGLVAEPRPGRSAPQVTRDLLGRPGRPQAIDDESRETWVPPELGAASTTFLREVVGHDGEIAGDVHQQVVDEVIALQLAIDRRSVSAEPLGDARDRYAGITEAGEETAFVEREVGERAGQAMSPMAVSSQK